MTREHFYWKIMDSAIENIGVQAILIIWRPSITRYCIQLEKKTRVEYRSGLKFTKENPASRP